MSRILIIDDEEKLAQLLKEGLEKSGHAVDYVTDGKAGKTRLGLYWKEYDLAIIDLMLPHENGFEITRAIREKNITLPILVLTARQDVQDKVRALDAGADDYLTKPFSIEELLARVRALLRRPEKLLPSQLKVGDLELDSSSRKLLVHDREVALTLKEFNLLEYFMKHPNHVLTREQIYDQLWDFASNSLSNIVDVHVKNLRKKIESRGRKKLLETVHGVGYRLRE